MKYDGHPTNKEKYVEELGDVAWYIAAGFNILKKTIDEDMATQNMFVVFKNNGIVKRPVHESQIMVKNCSKLNKSILKSKDKKITKNTLDKIYATDLYTILSSLRRLCLSLKVNLDDALEYNVKKLKKRYPNGFSTERSINR